MFVARLNGTIAILALLATESAVGQAEAALRPFVAVGLEPLLIHHDPPLSTSPRQTAFGHVLTFGVKHDPSNAVWGWEVRASAVWRANPSEFACLPNIVSHCNTSSTYSAYGVLGSARYRLRWASAIRPYLQAGAGVFIARESYPLPTVCDVLQGTCRLPRASETTWTPAAAGSVGVDVGRGRPHFFAEVSALQFLRGQRQTLLPFQVGLRL